MAPSRRPAALCVFLQLVTAAVSEQWYMVDPSVCRLSPTDTPTASAVHCDVGGNSITVKAADLDASIQDVYVTNANIIDVQDGALDQLDQLRTVHFSSASRLLLRTSSLAGAGATAGGATSLTIDGVTDVTLFADAFSGWLQPSSNITVVDVKTCSVASQAFPSGSNFSRVVMENIASLNMDSGAFSAAIGELRLTNVSSSYTCLADTFPGQIGRLVLHHFTMESIDDGCFRASSPWQRLDIRSSQLGAVPRDAFSGEIQQVRIDDTQLLNVSSGGFNLNVTSFSMEDCVVSALAGQALRVSAEDTITVSMLNVSQLERDAFRGLQSAANVTVSQLAVTRAASGALRLANWSSTVLSNILLSETCLCADVAGRAARLALGGSGQPDPANLTAEQLDAVHQVAFSTRCQEDGGGTALLAEFFCRRCVAGAGGLLPCPVSRPSAGGGWLMWPLVFILVLLLLTAGCGPLLVARRCRRTGPTGAAAAALKPPLDGPDGERHLTWRVVGELEEVAPAVDGDAPSVRSVPTGSGTGRLSGPEPQTGGQAADGSGHRTPPAAGSRDEHMATPSTGEGHRKESRHQSAAPADRGAEATSAARLSSPLRPDQPAGEPGRAGGTAPSETAG